jgi:hypothetical protein
MSLVAKSVGLFVNWKADTAGRLPVMSPDFKYHKMAPKSWKKARRFYFLPWFLSSLLRSKEKNAKQGTGEESQQ